MTRRLVSLSEEAWDKISDVLKANNYGYGDHVVDEFWNEPIDAQCKVILDAHYELHRLGHVGQKTDTVEKAHHLRDLADQLFAVHANLIQKETHD